MWTREQLRRSWRQPMRVDWCVCRRGFVSRILPHSPTVTVYSVRSQPLSRVVRPVGRCLIKRERATSTLEPPGTPLWIRYLCGTQHAWARWVTVKRSEDAEYARWRAVVVPEGQRCAPAKVMSLGSLSCLSMGEELVPSRHRARRRREGAHGRLRRSEDETEDRRDERRRDH